MNKPIPKLKKILWSFSGEDIGIISKCERKTQWAFANIGFLVMIIFIGCWVSASAFMSELFHDSSKWVSIPIGIIWALLITNIYLLLLYTISPTLLPVANKKKGKGKVRLVVTNDLSPKAKQNLVTTSLTLRLIFISALAFIIAQPLNVLIFSKRIYPILENYKAVYRTNMLIIADSALIQEEVTHQQAFFQSLKQKANPADSNTIAKNTFLINKKVDDDMAFLLNSKALIHKILEKESIFQFHSNKETDSLRTVLSNLFKIELSSDSLFLKNTGSLNFESTNLQAEFNNYKETLTKLVTAKINNYNELNILLGRSNFYIKKIQIILKDSYAGYFCSIIICSLFLLPIYNKFNVRNKKDFYPKKKEIENIIVENHYNNFKVAYSNLFNYKIASYNTNTINNINNSLSVLKQNCPDKYELIKNNFNINTLLGEVKKFEYWADPPFRTKRKPSNEEYKPESQLFKNIYPEEE